MHSKMISRSEAYSNSAVPLPTSPPPVQIKQPATNDRSPEAPSVALPAIEVTTQSKVASTTDPRYSLVSPVWQPLAGVSKQHTKIQKQVSTAASSQLPVFISSDAGLNKLRLATAIHTLGLTKKNLNKPMVIADCSTIEGQLQAELLLGGPETPSGPGHTSTNDPVLLGYLTGGTLMLKNVHKAPLKLLQAVDATLQYILAAAQRIAGPAVAQQGIAGSDTPGKLLQTLGTRLVFTSRVPLTQLVEMLRQPDLSGPASGFKADSQAGPSAFHGLSSCSSITIPPLRARASDIAPLALWTAVAEAELRGYGSVTLTSEAVKQLTGYHFPGNEDELEGLVQRAVMLHPAAAAATSPSNRNSTSLGAYSLDTACDGPMLVLDQDEFWAATEDADRERVDVLELLPWLRPYLLDTQLWPHGLNSITTWLYPLIVASLFLGPQEREHSAALTVFWAGWWPLVMLSYPFIGRAWCAICPFMITGQQAQRIVEDDSTPSEGTTTNSATDPFMGALKHRWRQLHQLLPEQLRWQPRSWPSIELRAYADWAMVAGFAAILLWEEVWDLPHHADLSGWLLLLITAGAVGCSIIFERRLWCRALCPIGGMNGLFAKMAMIEIRSRPGLCAASACGRPCHKGRWVAAGTPITGSAAPTLEHPRSTPNAETPSPSAPAAAATSVHATGLRATAASTADASGSNACGAMLLPGCPMNTRPGSLIDNHDCIMCGNCLRSCESGSAQWRLRPPAADLWGDHSAAWHELTLMYVLLGAVLLHRLPELCDQLGVPADILLGQQGPHLALSALLLAAPGAVAWTWNKAGAAVIEYLEQRTSTAVNETQGEDVDDATAVGNGDNQVGDIGVDPEVPYIKLAYSLLPLVWAGTLAHYEDLMMNELGLLLPRLATSLGVDGTADWLNMLPVIGPAPAAVVSAAQGVTLVVGVVLSWALAGRIAEVEVGRQQAGEVTAVQRALILATAAELWHLIV